MNFRLLGSLEISIDGTSVELRSNRLRVVLAFLLLHAGRVVPVGRLVDALWDDDPPVTAKGQVQTCISTLRHLFAGFGYDGLVLTSSAGYTLQVPGGALDVANFAGLVAQARAAADQRAEEAIRGFRAALALWRGPAAEDVQSGLIQAMAARLNEERLGAQEECIQLELALGRHHSFDEPTAVELLARLIGPVRVQAEPEAALILVRLCDCLPLAVRIVGARLATRRHWSIRQMIRRMTDESRRLDELAISGVGIRATLAASFSSLSPSERRLFVRLSLLGTSDFAEWVSAPLPGLRAGLPPL
jgi:hypothetical protein